jgi:hypothetical protein
MEDNEAIEIVGAERFSQYMGLVLTLSILLLDLVHRLKRKSWIVPINYEIIQHLMTFTL